MRTGIAALASVLGGVLVALWLSGWRLVARVTSWSELESYYLPKFEYTAERLAAGALPLWNPFEFCGLPLLATLQSGVIYPPLRLVYGFVPTEFAYPAFFLLHVALASLFTLALARSLGCSLWPSVLAAAWVVQPSWIVRMYDNPEYLAGVTWIPLLILLAERLFSHPSARAVALLGCVGAIQSVSGYPPFSLATLYVLLLGVPFWIFEQRRRAKAGEMPRTAAGLALAAALAACLACIQLLPTLDHLAQTNREALAGSTQVAWLELSERSPETLAMINIRAASLGKVAVDWFRESGPILLALGSVAPVFFPRSASVWYLFFATLVFSFLPLPIIQRLPLYQFVRSGVEWNFIAPLLVYTLAGVGLEGVLRRLPPARVLAPAATLTLLALTTGWNWRTVPQRWIEPAAKPALVLPAEVERECDLGRGRARLYWPEGQAWGESLRERIESIGGYEQSLMPARNGALVDALGVGSGVPGGWIEGFASHPDLVARMGVRCAIARNPRRERGARRCSSATRARCRERASSEKRSARNHRTRPWRCF
jgi:hypothetical protein